MSSYRHPDNQPLASPSELAGPLVAGPEEAVGGRTLYLDTFDRRLARRDLRLTLEEGSDGERRLRARGRHEVACPWPAPGPPAFAADLPPGRLRDVLAPVAGVRRLLPLALVERRGRRVTLRDTTGKTIGSLQAEERKAWPSSAAGLGHALPPRWVARPLRGYEAEAETAAAEIARRVGLRPDSVDELTEALAAHGRTLASPFLGPDPTFAPTTAAPAAAAEVLARLLATVEANLPGLRQDLDTEFVHDLRVALRRARSLLRELRSALPGERIRWLRDGLAWLAELTGPVRDQDVLLLALPEYASALPAPRRSDLQPLIAALTEARRDSLAILLAALDSPSGLALLTDWRAVARELADAPGPPLRPLADRRLRKLGRRVAKRAAKATPRTPATDLHQLRIEAKRLRYLLEFCRSLYDAQRVTAVLRTLRRLQETLGDLQDLAVHAARLEALEPNHVGWPTATWVGKGRLLAEIERRAVRRRRKIDKQARRFVDDEPGRLARLLASEAASESA